VDFSPTLQLDGVYDDNIFSRSEDDPRLPVEEDFFTRIVPAAAFSYGRGGPTQFLVRYQNEFLFHKNFPERDATGDNHGFTVAADRAFGQRYSAALDDTFRIGSDVSSIAEAAAAGPTQPAGILPRGREYRTNNLRLSGTHALTRRLDFTGDVTYDYNWYGGGASGTGGTPTDSLETEDHLASIFLTSLYALTTAHALTGTLGFSHNEYDLEGKARYLTATAGYQGRIAEPLTLQGSVGLQYLNEDSSPDPAIPSQRQESVWPRADLSATLAFYEFSVYAAGSVGLNDSSGYGGTAIQRQVRAGVDYRPWRDITLRAFGLYTKSDSTADEETDFQDLESFQSGAGAAYRFSSWCTARLDYTYIDQDSSGTTGTDYKDNRIVIGLSLSLPDTLR
jgi:opacity protein-like surface antigen